MPSVQGVLQSLLCLFYAMFSSSVLLAPSTLLLLVFPPGVYVSVVSIPLKIFYTLVAAVVEQLGQVKYVLSGDIPMKGESALLISNHRTRTDWLYSWAYALRALDLAKLKQAPKDDTRKLPGVGWAMQFLVFFFFKRAGNWEADKKMIADTLDFCVLAGTRPSTLLFPEGTDFTPKTKGRSDEFAEKNGLVKYDYCLHPRTTGFVYMVEKMRGRIDSVLDVTMAYTGKVPQAETHLVTLDMPKQCHIHVKRFPINMVPTNAKELEEWLSKRWEEKEKRLKAFHTEGAESFNKLGEELAKSAFPSVAAYQVGALVFCGWFCVTCLYGMIAFPWFRYYNLAMWALIVAATRFSPGIEKLIYGYALKKAENTKKATKVKAKKMQ